VTRAPISPKSAVPFVRGWRGLKSNVIYDSMATQSSGQALLMKERPLSSRKSKTILIELNSRDRNYLNLVKSNPFQYILPSPIKDIRSIELIGGTIPAKISNVNASNNKFTFVESGVRRTIVIPPGYYSEEALLESLASLLSHGSQSLYGIEVTSLGKLVIFQERFPQPFGILFLSSETPDVLDPVNGALLEMKTPALLLGFDMSDYYSLNGGIMSPNAFDLNTTSTRIYLYMNFQNSLDLSCISRGAGRRSPFAIIYLDKESRGYKFLNKETLSPISYSLPQPIGRLTNIQVEFRDEFHQVVDFNGKDFSLLLECTVLE